MREYETIFITKTSLPESQLTELNSRLDSMLEKHEGHLFFSKSMGKRKLAYPIQKELSGVYTHIDYAAGGKFVSEMERRFKLDENVMRFLTIIKNEDVDVEARTAEVVARGEDVGVQETKPAEVKTAAASTEAPKETAKETVAPVEAPKKTATEAAVPVEAPKETAKETAAPVVEEAVVENKTKNDESKKEA
jgi:small subunit ribosomal protein S6